MEHMQQHIPTGTRCFQQQKYLVRKCKFGLFGEMQLRGHGYCQGASPLPRPPPQPHPMGWLKGGGTVGNKHVGSPQSHQQRSCFILMAEMAPKRGQITGLT